MAWKIHCRIWPLLKKYDLVVETRRIERATMFKLNTESPITKALWELALQIAKHDANKIAKKELKKKIKVPAETLTS